MKDFTVGDRVAVRRLHGEYRETVVWAKRRNSEAEDD